MASNRKRVSLNLQQKYEIVKLFKGGMKISDISKKQNIPRQTVSGFCQQSKADKIINMFESGNTNTDAKRQKLHNFEEIDEPLLQFFRLLREKMIPVSGDMLLKKAQSFAMELHLSEVEKLDMNWINRWKRRNNIMVKKLHGEAQSVDEASVIDWTNTRLAVLLQEYAPVNILNCDETGLFYR